MNILAKNYLPKIFLCCLGFCLCIVSSAENATSTQKMPITRLPSVQKSKDNFEEYDANDGDLLFDNFKTYGTDENIEKGIRKLDTSVESAEKVYDDRAPSFVNSTSEMSKSGIRMDHIANLTISSIDRNDEEEGVIFEDSEANNLKSNISGTLVTKLIPEILKYNGRMVIPDHQEPLKGEEQEQKANVTSENKSVVQKMPSRRVRQQSNLPPTMSSAFFSRNISRLQDIFDLYNPYRLFDIWEESEELEKLSPLCRTQTEVFLLALRRGDSWAVKSK